MRSGTSLPARHQSPKSFVGGLSSPMLFDPIAATGHKSVGLESPPTKNFAVFARSG
ncbi:DUF6053 domain-containing protein [Lysobacter capsici]|uniref:DUF6053 domain-containing protein n=1 Tax=Lysobacter capsici TaxID=435897 RepID=UPI003D2F8B9A